jgi:hypothetical protein
VNICMYVLLDFQLCCVTYDIYSSHGGNCEDYHLLGCDAVSQKSIILYYVIV